MEIKMAIARQWKCYETSMLATSNPICRKVSSWSYGCLIYNYQCNQCLSPLKLCTRYNIMW